MGPDGLGPDLAGGRFRAQEPRCGMQISRPPRRLVLQRRGGRGKKDGVRRLKKDGGEARQVGRDGNLLCSGPKIGHGQTFLGLAERAVSNSGPQESNGN
jgi:hypothetical protein